MIKKIALIAAVTFLASGCAGAAEPGPTVTVTAEAAPAVEDASTTEATGGADDDALALCLAALQSSQDVASYAGEIIGANAIALQATLDALDASIAEDLVALEAAYDDIEAAKALTDNEHLNVLIDTYLDERELCWAAADGA